MITSLTACCLQRDDPWTVRILPRVQLGVPNSPAYGLSPSDPSVVVLHHALASWRIQRRCAYAMLCSYNVLFSFLLQVVDAIFSLLFLFVSEAALAGRLSFCERPTLHAC